MFRTDLVLTVVLLLGALGYTIFLSEEETVSPGRQVAIKTQKLHSRESEVSDSSAQKLYASVPVSVLRKPNEEPSVSEIVLRQEAIAERTGLDIDAVRNVTAEMPSYWLTALAPDVLDTMVKQKIESAKKREEKVSNEEPPASVSKTPYADALANLRAEEELISEDERRARARLSLDSYLRQTGSSIEALERRLATEDEE